jgi:hypothetical protein
MVGVSHRAALARQWHGGNVSTEDGPENFVVSMEFGTEIKQQCELHGEDVVLWAWRTFFKQFLPFAAVLLSEQQLVSQASALGLDVDKALEALKLLACLRAAEEPHNAWLAAEVIMRHVPKEGAATLAAAMQPPPERAN